MTSRAAKPAASRGFCSTLIRCATGIAALFAATALTVPAFTTSAAAATFTPIDLGEPNTTALFMNGQIVPGDLTRLQAETAKVAKGRRIVLMLESPGGGIDEGMALGRYVYEQRIATFVVAGPGCHSACTFIFLAGRDLTSGNPMRTMMAGGKLGFHQTAFTLDPNRKFTAQEVQQATNSIQAGIGRLEAYFRDIKVGPEFLALTLATPGGGGTTPIGELEALRLGINLFDAATQRLIRANTPPDKISSR